MLKLTFRWNHKGALNDLYVYIKQNLTRKTFFSFLLSVTNNFLLKVFCNFLICLRSYIPTFLSLNDYLILWQKIIFSVNQVENFPFLLCILSFFILSSYHTFLLYIIVTGLIYLLLQRVKVSFLTLTKMVVLLDNIKTLVSWPRKVSYSKVLLSFSSNQMIKMITLKIQTAMNDNRKNFIQ